MSDSIRVRVIGPQFRHAYEQYEEGDELEVSEETLEKHPASIEPVGEDDADGAQESTDGEEIDGEDGLTVDDLDPHPDDLTVSELEDRVADVDDAELLETILEAERADGEPRVGAVGAVEDRLGELEG